MSNLKNITFSIFIIAFISFAAISINNFRNESVINKQQVEFKKQFECFDTFRTPVYNDILNHTYIRNQLAYKLKQSCNPYDPNVTTRCDVDVYRNERGVQWRITTYTFFNDKPGMVMNRIIVSGTQLDNGSASDYDQIERTKWLLGEKVKVFL